MGLNAAECREMIEAAKANGVILMEAFMYRYSDRTHKVLEVLRSGVLGEIKFIHSSFRFLLGNPASIKFRPELGGGSLYDVGCYPLNFAGLVLDEVNGGVRGGIAARPVSISTESVSEQGIDVLFSALLKYPSGVIASLHSGFNAQKRVFSEVVGTKGVLEVPDTFFENPGSLTLTMGEDRREIAVAASDRYRAEVEDFAEAIQQRRAPLFSLEETLRNAEVMDQIFAAAALKR
jgi:predicted dehydrogenase